jgi:hypothetical protein
MKTETSYENLLAQKEESTQTTMLMDRLGAT